MSEMYGITICVVKRSDVPTIVTKYKSFPGKSRHCTDRLKIQPSKAFYRALARYQGQFQVWCGMRSDESKERAAWYRHVLDTEVYPLTKF